MERGRENRGQHRKNTVRDEHVVNNVRVKTLFCLLIFPEPTRLEAALFTAYEQ